MIRFEHTRFAYDKTPVIDDVSFTVAKGDFAALIGANGAGKSTITKLCNGLLKPQSGRVVLNGLDTKTTKTSLLAKTTGFLFQNPDRQICKNTIAEEILFGLEFVFDDEAKRKDQCQFVLEQFKFDGKRDPFSMSRGERQRIALASLLARDPQIMILDEPTTGLDYRECTQIMEMIAERNASGVTVLMVTHDMEITQDYAKHVLVLNQGKLLGDGDVADVMTNRAVLEAASVSPAQIPALAMRFGPAFTHVSTPEQMAERIARGCRA